MIVTTLEARLDEDQARRLVVSFEATGDSLPSAIVESFLVRQLDGDVWRIVTVWESRDALDGYRASVDTPEGVVMFRSAGAEPTLSILEVKSHVERSPGDNE